MSILPFSKISYDEVGVEAFYEGEDICVRYIIKDKHHRVMLKWNKLRNNILNPTNDLVSSITSHIKKLSPDDYHVLTSTYMSSFSLSENSQPESDNYLIKNFLRGLYDVIVLSDMIRRYSYIKTKSLPTGREILSINNLKNLKMCIIVHMKFNPDSLFMKHCLDFINRWSLFFTEGDPVPNIDILLELVINYFSPPQKRQTENSLEERIRRIESILGI